MKRIFKDYQLIKNNYITKKYPISLVHFVTNRCNARCSFCFIDFDNPETFKGELTLDEIEKFSKTIGPSIQNINLTGGEPFARKEFSDICKIYLKNTDIRSLFITSNGSLPDRIDKFLDELAKKNLDRQFIFSFSIDNIPDKHNKIRKINNLFEKCLESYKIVNSYGENCFANISITVSLENYEDIDEIYSELLNRYNVKAITACLVRDEGVYKTPEADKKKILSAYINLTEKIKSDSKSGKLKGYKPSSIQGRMMNKKNEIMYEKIISTYLEPQFISQCYAGSLFGIISADGKVYPCEILKDSIGNLRNYEMNFLNLWQDHLAKKTRKWIKDTKCNCCYECAWSFNILGNLKYQKDLFLAAINKGD
jgi:radical SAM protein with 4Fe4S-binding SPASM domain